MPRRAYTSKQERKAKDIEGSYEKRGVSEKEAERRAWATVNKQDHGRKNSGSGRKTSRSEAAQGLGNAPPTRPRLRAVSRAPGFQSRVPARGARCARGARASA
jgi:plasmid stabilization system protein ParE